MLKPIIMGEQSLIREGRAKEIMHVIQQLRKKLSMDMQDYMNISISCSDRYMNWSIYDFEKKIRDHCRIISFDMPDRFDNSFENPKLISDEKHIFNFKIIDGNYTIKDFKDAVYIDCSIIITLQIIPYSTIGDNHES